jgi:hypothetical protein
MKANTVVSNAARTGLDDDSSTFTLVIAFKVVWYGAAEIHG